MDKPSFVHLFRGMSDVQMHASIQILGLKSTTSRLALVIPTALRLIGLRLGLAQAPNLESLACKTCTFAGLNGPMPFWRRQRFPPSLQTVTVSWKDVKDVEADRVLKLRCERYMAVNRLFPEPVGSTVWPDKTRGEHFECPAHQAASE